MRVERVHGREVLNSRGYPTVEVEVTLSDGSTGSAMVPSGVSVGSNEARELLDSDRERWSGRGVLRAVSNINGAIGRTLRGTEAGISEVDKQMIELDGTRDKSNLGANAILALSLANARAIASSRRIPLYELLRESSGAASPSIPTPMVNIISGGLHADTKLDVQDFMVVPTGAPSFHAGLDWVGSVYHATRRLLSEMGFSTLLADEGGFGPRLRENEEALKILVKAIEVSGLEPGKDMAIAVDVASSHFFKDKSYRLTGQGKSFSSSDMVNLLEGWISEYPIISLEDGCAEDDWGGWEKLTTVMGSKVQLVGDDLFVTDPSLIEEGGRRKVANAVLIKLNQIGTLSETLESIQVCRKIGYAPVISARSGETEDSFIADLAVGTSAGQIKIGSIARSERAAKYNQLLRLEERLGWQAPYAGQTPFPFLRG